jgi:ParB-like chromosome segregation protein Spo0J
LGWKEIEAQVVDISGDEADVANFKLNSERGQLNPVKVATLFDKERGRGLSQEKIGKKYNLTQQRVSQYLEILTFPEEIQHLLTSRLVKFAMEHARKIVGTLDDPRLQSQMAERVIEEGLSVRETEVAIKEFLEERRKEEDWAKRKAELMEIIDFATRSGAWKSEHCKHRDEDGYCRKWCWSDEPISWKERVPWLELREIEGKWYSKASPKECALCESYTQEGGEVDELRGSVNELDNEVYGPLSSLSSACKANGEWKKKHCSHYVGGFCRYWNWTSEPVVSYMLGKPAVEPGGKWRIDPDPQYCATCPTYKGRE